LKNIIHFDSNTREMAFQRTNGQSILAPIGLPDPRQLVAAARREQCRRQALELLKLCMGLDQRLGTDR